MCISVDFEYGKQKKYKSIEKESKRINKKTCKTSCVHYPKYQLRGLDGHGHF